MRASSVLAALVAVAMAAPAQTRLAEWEKGLLVERRDQKDMAIFLWFYEWQMFDAIRAGAHVSGTWDNPRTFSPDGNTATIFTHMMRLAARAVDDGADLTLEVTNRSVDQPWPEIAGVIPCFNPGRKAGTTDLAPLPENASFGDLNQRHTYFLGPDGLLPLESRALHFNHKIRPTMDREAKSGPLPFSNKWPTAAPDAKAGIIIRESEDGQWVTAIAWDDFLSVQAHNPWHCMHLSVRVGPLKPGESKIIRGKIYLFKGNRNDCLAHFQKDFKEE